MIVADSSVWIPFFRRDLALHTAELARYVADGHVFLPDLVVTEVLQGCTTERAFQQMLTAFNALPGLVTSDSELAIAAALNYRTLRAIGVTVRSTINTLIATRCIVDGLRLLHADRDYLPFERYLGLQVVPVPAAS